MMLNNSITTSTVYTVCACFVLHEAQTVEHTEHTSHDRLVERNHTHAKPVVTSHAFDSQCSPHIWICTDIDSGQLD